MRALSIHEPGATLIAIGKKSIETRSRRPPAYLIGERIAIHATKRKPTRRDLLRLQGSIDSEWYRDSFTMLKLISGMPLGKVVATAVLSRAMQVKEVISWGSDKAYAKDDRGTVLIPVDLYGDFSPGRWLWILTDVEKVDPPIPATGHQGLWEWE